jgi:hypothetical protein
MTIERDSVLRMLGEFLREAAVLVAVFGPLEGLVRVEGVVRGLTPLSFSAIVGLTTILLVSGIAVERNRKS